MRRAGIRGRLPSHGTVVAYVALFVALGAGAYAAGLAKNSVKSKNIAPKQVKRSDIAPNAVDGSRVKDDSLTGADILESTLQDPDDSLSPGDPLPSGKTETGAWSWYDTFQAGGTVYVGVTLPFPAPVALSDATVNFAPSGLASDDDATCAGTAETPTAPPGRVCIYVDTGTSSPSAIAGNAIGNPGPSKVGFEVASENGGDNGFADGTWAYTAP
jgi:hypothetical protein